jgi:ATP synthase protein I
VINRPLSTVNRILSYQILIIAITTLGFFIASGMHASYSNALGGLVAFIPNMYFSIRIIKSAGKQARKIVNSFYAGEAGKLLLTGGMFFVVFQLPGIQILPLLVGYITALSVFWFALLMR